MRVGMAAGTVVPARQPPPPGGDRQGHAPVRLHDREGAGGGLHRGRHGRVPARADADAGRGDADALAARRSRRDDLGLAQPLSTTTASSCSAPTATSCPTRSRAQIEALMDEDIEMAWPTTDARPRQAHRRRPGPLHRDRQAHLAALDVAVGPAHRHRLRQRRRLQGRARRRCGNWAPRSSPIGVEPERLQHQRGMRLDPSGRRCRRRCTRSAPTSASRSTATPTAW